MRFGEGLALAACRECRVDQRRGVGAAADVGVADGRHLAVRAGERDLPGSERPIGVRDLRLRLLAGEPAEFRAADADAGQDPAVVLLAPCVQAAGADADGEQEAQDERDAEAEGERPSAPRPCRGLAVGHGGREGQDRHGIDAGLGGRRRVRRGGVGGSPGAGTSAACIGGVAPRASRRRRSVRLGRCARRTSAASSGSPAGVSPSGWRRWQPGRLRSWAGRSSDAHARSAGAGPRPRQPRHLRVCARMLHATVVSAGGTGTRDRPQTLRGRTTEVPGVATHASCGWVSHTPSFVDPRRPAVRRLTGQAASDGRSPMPREIVNTPDAPGSAAYGSFPYSQAVKAAGLVFVSGQGPFDPATGSIVGETIEEQTRQALANCDAILRAAALALLESGSGPRSAGV